MRNPVVRIVSAYIIWGVSPLFWILLSHLEALDQLVWRAIFSWLILSAALVVFAFRRKRNSRTKRDIFFEGTISEHWLTFLAALTLFAHWLFFLWAIATERTLQSSLGYFVSPLLTFAVGVLFLHEVATKTQKAAMTIAGCGAGILCFDLSTAPHITLGIAGTFTLYGLLKKKSRLPTTTGFAIELSIIAPLAIMGAGIRQFQGTNIDFTLRNIALLLLGAALFTLLPFMLFSSGAQDLPLTLAGLLLYINPVLQFFVGWLILGEGIELLQFGSFVLIWIAILLILKDHFLQLFKPIFIRKLQ